MNAATSPVCAPSLISVEQSCAATLMFEPSSRSHTVFNDVKTGAITTSQWFAFATKGFSASTVSTDSLTVLYIFQFPAITGLRMFSRLISQRFNTRQLLAGEILQRRAAASRDMRDAIGNSRTSHGRNR